MAKPRTLDDETGRIQKDTNIKIEIVSSEFGVMNGSIMYKNLKAGSIQLNFQMNPKRVGNLIRALRKDGVEINLPQYDEK